MFSRASTLLVATALSLLSVLAHADEPKLAQPAREEVVLAVGEQRTLELPGVDRMVVVAPHIASVTPDGEDRLRVKGSTPGTTELKVWSAAGVRTILLIVK